MKRTPHRAPVRRRAWGSGRGDARRYRCRTLSGLPAHVRRLFRHLCRRSVPLPPKVFGPGPTAPTRRPPSGEGYSAVHRGVDPAASHGCVGRAVRQGSVGDRGACRRLADGPGAPPPALMGLARSRGHHAEPVRHGHHPGQPLGVAGVVRSPTIPRTRFHVKQRPLGSGIPGGRSIPGRRTYRCHAPCHPCQASDGSTPPAPMSRSGLESVRSGKRRRGSEDSTAAWCPHYRRAVSLRPSGGCGHACPQDESGASTDLATGTGRPPRAQPQPKADDLIAHATRSPRGS